MPYWTVVCQKQEYNRDFTQSKSDNLTFCLGLQQMSHRKNSSWKVFAEAPLYPTKPPNHWSSFFVEDCGYSAITISLAWTGATQPCHISRPTYLTVVTANSQADEKLYLSQTLKKCMDSLEMIMPGVINNQIIQHNYTHQMLEHCMSVS